MSINSLFNRIKALKTQIAPVAKTWYLIREEGETLSEDFKALLSPDDTLVIREYPRGYLGETIVPSQVERAYQIRRDL